MLSPEGNEAGPSPSGSIDLTSSQKRRIGFPGHNIIDASNREPKRLCLRNGKSSDFDIPQDLLVRTLECPVCLDVPALPITSCRNGHFVCGNCRPTLTTCGICRAELTGARNFAVEALVEGIQTECKHLVCTERVKYIDLRSHMEVCDYRPIVCSNTTRATCKKEPVEWGYYIEHLKRVHRSGPAEAEVLVNGWCAPQRLLFWDEIKDLNELEADMRRQGGVRIYQTEDGIHFMLNTRRDKDVGFVWITAMLTEPETASFGAELYILKDRPENGDIGPYPYPYHVKWNLAIATVHKTLTALKFTNYCAEFTMRSLIAFSTIDQNENWNVHFQIRITRV